MIQPMLRFFREALADATQVELAMVEAGRLDGLGSRCGSRRWVMIKMSVTLVL